MKITLQSTDEHIVPDWGFTLYFVGMFCFYKHTYFQLAIQLFIIAYVLVKKITQNVSDNVIKYKFSKPAMENLIFYLAWTGMLTFMLYISRQTYAVYKYETSNVLLTMFRIFVIGFVIFYYAETKVTALSVVEAMVVGVFAMSILVMAITPPSAYFNASSVDGFGALIAQHRNQIGAACATAFMLSYYLRRYAKFYGGYFICAFLVIVAVLSGSRGALVQLAIEVLLMLFFNGNFIALFVVLILGGSALVIIRNVPILYDNIWLRFMNAADTLTGGEATDGSTLTRQYYKEIAWMMFKRHPIRGYGLDGFRGYLVYHPVYKGLYIPAKYSHCNFSELMSSLGAIGLSIWYIPTFTLLIKGIKRIKFSRYIEMATIILSSLIILDYARIPWSSHLGMYMYFAVYIILLNFIRFADESKPAKAKISSLTPEEMEAIRSTNKKSKKQESDEEISFTIVTKEK